MKQRLKVEVHGIVPGVGFRPYIYRLAHRFNRTAAGFIVHQHSLVPPGDGGLNLGQLVIAANSLPHRSPPQ